MQITKKYIIHDNNTNLTNFNLIQTIIGESDTDYEIDNITGQEIQKEDFDIVKEIAVDLFSFGSTREFDSVMGSTFYIELIPDN